MRTIIVGGGWSGLATAIALIDQGAEVQVFEAGGILGGRARSVNWQNIVVDNGQHLTIGAYQNMLSLMAHIGLDVETLFRREPLNLVLRDKRYKSLKISTHGKLTSSFNRLYHLWQSGGLSSIQAIHRLQTYIKQSHRLEATTVAELVTSSRQPQRLIDQLWEPLTLAMLNTPINLASAQVFADVLNASLFADKNAAELLIPTQPLSDVFPTPAGKYIVDNGGYIQLNNRVKSLIIDDGIVKGIIDQYDQRHFADNVVLALPPSALNKLLPIEAQLENVDEYPICTLYLQYQSSLRAPQPITGLSGTISQWLFDRSIQKPGLMAVVISGPGEHTQLSKQALIEVVSSELNDLIPNWPETAEHALVIREKRATFAATPESQKQRPTCHTTIKGLWLAGDYVKHAFPATLETAIGNGLECGRQILPNHIVRQ
ncbi:hydroxysqualene dehydroxylase HpnE [Methylophaga sp. OBS3]|uniref:hydroxysqualene dehydroxylase HpnE n=1 Tax=Methylophaga sp. OBS3 TaxID=2991934 RepID=UPI00224DD8F8|nr:hydroxysqualene dehydroxylase HpnE [Methylophaga sp. OBS3]